jgi:hypothetical protein
MKMAKEVLKQGKHCLEWCWHNIEQNCSKQFIRLCTCQWKKPHQILNNFYGELSQTLKDILKVI